MLSVTDIDVLSVKELKQALTSCRVDHSTFCEKSELRAALKEALLAESGPESADYSGYDKEAQQPVYSQPQPAKPVAYVQPTAYARPADKSGSLNPNEPQPTARAQPTVYAQPAQTQQAQPQRSTVEQTAATAGWMAGELSSQISFASFVVRAKSRDRYPCIHIYFDGMTGLHVCATGQAARIGIQGFSGMLDARKSAAQRTPGDSTS
jgi:hypothetical protein